MDQKSRLLTPLMIAAVISVFAFSAIGIAAITGHLPIAHSYLNPFASFVNAIPSAIAQVSAKPMHEGLTRSLGEAPIPRKPVDFRAGAAVPTHKSICPNCGVVDSIQHQEAKVSAFSGAASAIGEVTGSRPEDRDNWNAAIVPGVAASVYAGNESQREARAIVSFVVTVRMENGTVRTIRENQRPSFSIGERVKLVNGSVIPLG